MTFVMITIYNVSFRNVSNILYANLFECEFNVDAILMTFS